MRQLIALHLMIMDHLNLSNWQMMLLTRGSKGLQEKCSNKVTSALSRYLFPLEINVQFPHTSTIWVFCFWKYLLPFEQCCLLDWILHAGNYILSPYFPSYIKVLVFETSDPCSISIFDLQPKICTQHLYPKFLHVQVWLSGKMILESWSASPKVFRFGCQHKYFSCLPNILSPWGHIYFHKKMLKWCQSHIFHFFFIYKSNCHVASFDSLFS